MVEVVALTGHDEVEALRLAAAESASEHPLARAVMAAANACLSLY